MCPICGTASKMPHYKTCGKDYPRNEFRLQVLVNNHSKIDLSDKELLHKLYVEDELSSVDFYKMFDVNIGVLYFVLDMHGIPKRNLAAANSTNAVKKKVRETCLSKYGTTNVLSKGSVGYITRQTTLKKRYGVVNVFQLEEIKDKITKTHLERYGKKRVNIYENLTDEQLYMMHLKKQNTMIANGTLPRYFKINKLETRVANCLTFLGVPFQYSFFIKRFQYDFLINNDVILEVHGDFWHANPKFYTENSLLNFPGKATKITAKDIWNKDLKKRNIAIKSGYRYLSIWENDINSKTDIELKQFILSQLSTVFELHPVL
jgi:G:T-mismatch repair DNA endonuclease (very short patch repair protein)